MQRRTLYLAESTIAVLCAALALLSALWPEWIESLLGLAPDGGDGSAEWGVVVAFGLASLVSGALARLQRRRLRAAV
jgi:hypothetical protein